MRTPMGLFGKDKSMRPPGNRAGFLLELPHADGKADAAASLIGHRCRTAQGSRAALRHPCTQTLA